MKFNQSANFFYPETIKNGSTNEENAVTRPPLVADLSKVYIVPKDAIVRIVPAVDTYVRFTDDGTDSAATNATNGVLLKANIPEFLFSGKAKFMVASDTTGNVILVRGE